MSFSQDSHHAPSSCGNICGGSRVLCATGPTGPTGPAGPIGPTGPTGPGPGPTGSISPTQNYLQASFSGIPGGFVISSIDAIGGSSITLSPPTLFINLAAGRAYEVTLVGRGPIDSSISITLNDVILRTVTGLAEPFENLINTLIFNTPPAPPFSTLSFILDPPVGPPVINPVPISISIIQIS
ncbi:hypothetical protein [Pasteuria penetrans]|uniref:hypothetical protein n=1 Tax=Pasteuria penetrans TaxID=86005 RepID=UPI000FC34FBA|nr:hypothetical protein [Pasteuria penetrans]